MKSEETPENRKQEQDMTSSSFEIVEDLPERSVDAQVANDERAVVYRGPDRRKPSLKSFVHGAFNPRRRRIRREEDRDSTFIDWYPTHLLVAATLIMCLSVVDGLFTVLGEEERKIRADPVARSTELLRRVFG